MRESLAEGSAALHPGLWQCRAFSAEEYSGCGRGVSLGEHMKQRFLWGGLGCGVLAASYLAAIAALGLWARPAGADLAIVLGNEVLASGEPSPRLRARLDAALGVYRAGQSRIF